MSKNRLKENNFFYARKHSMETIEKLRDRANKRNYLPVKKMAPKQEVTYINTKTTTL